MVSRKMVIFQIIFRAALDAIFAGLRLRRNCPLQNSRREKVSWQQPDEFLQDPRKTRLTMTK